MKEGNLEDFKGVIPVPMQAPGDRYGDKRPWYFTEQ